MSKEDTKKRILEVANQLFSEKGFSATTTREIAAAAQVNELTLFRHFCNKESLFQEVASQFAAVRNVSVLFDSFITGNLQADLKMIASTFFDLVLQDSSKIKLAHLESPSNPMLREAASQFPNQLRDYLASYFSRLHAEGKIRADDYDLLAEMFFCVIFYHVLARCNFPSGDKLRSSSETEIAETIAALFANSLLI